MADFTAPPVPTSAILSISGGVGKAVTGDLSDHDVLSKTILASQLGTSGVLRATVFFRTSGNANSKTLRVKFGGVTLESDAVTITPGNGIDWWVQVVLWNQGAKNAQGLVSFISANNVIQAGSYNTATIDTTVNQLFEVTMALQNVNDSFTSNFAMLELLIPPPS